MALDVLLTVEEAAALLKLSKHTLNRWRVTGEGPPFVKYGRRLVRYVSEDLEAWGDAQRRTMTQRANRPQENT